jgi:hypothetical protein
MFSNEKSLLLGLCIVSIIILVIGISTWTISLLDLNVGLTGGQVISSECTLNKSNGKYICKLNVLYKPEEYPITNILIIESDSIIKPNSVIKVSYNKNNFNLVEIKKTNAKFVSSSSLLVMILIFIGLVLQLSKTISNDINKVLDYIPFI